MSPALYAKLHAAIEAVVRSDDEDREFYVYPELVSDVADAARHVYDICEKAGNFAYDQSNG